MGASNACIILSCRLTYVHKLPKDNNLLIVVGYIACPKVKYRSEHFFFFFHLEKPRTVTAQYKYDTVFQLPFSSAINVWIVFENRIRRVSTAST